MQVNIRVVYGADCKAVFHFTIFKYIKSNTALTPSIDIFYQGLMHPYTLTHGGL